MLTRETGERLEIIHIATVYIGHTSDSTFELCRRSLWNSLVSWFFSFNNGFMVTNNSQYQNLLHKTQSAVYAPYKHVRYAPSTLQQALHTPPILHWIRHFPLAKATGVFLKYAWCLITETVQNLHIMTAEPADWRKRNQKDDKERQMKKTR